MDYVTLGRSDLRVSRLCLGTMNFGGSTPEPEARRIIDRALDAGINFLDTAFGYQGGRSEEIVGRAAKGRRDRLVIATKVWPPNTREHILECADTSLQRLGLDYVDLYQLHRSDAQTPIEESLSALGELVKAGKARYVGCTTFPAWRIAEAVLTAERLGLPRFVSEQPHYNILDRHIENEIIPCCRALGLGIIPWSPLAGGLLAGRYRPDQAPPADSRAAHPDWFHHRYVTGIMVQHKFEIVDKIAALARDRGLTLAQFSLGWTLSNPDIASPILGPRTLEHLEDCLQARPLGPDDLAAVDQIVPPRSFVPPEAPFSRSGSISGLPE